MTLSNIIRDMEKDKFTTDTAGARAVNTVVGGGSLAPVGLSTGGRVTSLTLTDGTWVKLPTTALTNRNAVGFQNDTASYIYVNFDLDGDPNTQGYTTGWKIPSGGEFFVDLTGAVDVWVLPESGTTPTITVLEVA